MNKGIFINDSLHGLIPITYFEKKIISQAGFNRLHDVYQNSTVYLTFPSNRTKRFEHSIGTMKLCSDMFFYSVQNVEDESILKGFLKKGEDEIDKIIKKCTSLENTDLNKIIDKPIGKFSDSLIPKNIKEEKGIKIFYILMQTVRVAALLHDIGHPPYSHVVEHALSNVLKLCKDETGYSYDNGYLTKKEKEDMNKKELFVCIFEDNKSNSKQKLHEQMGNNISREIIENVANRDLENRDFYLLIGELVQELYSEEEAFFKGLHRIIDSSVDGDRLDYVTRDSINSGLTTGSIDYNRIIQGMELYSEEEAFYFTFSMKSITSIEDFLRRRFNIYQDIIFHHRVVKMNYLLQNIVEKLTLKYLNDETERSNGTFIADISGLWSLLDLENLTELLPQWTDSWLMTILKKIYMSDYQKIDVDKEDVLLDDIIIKKQLEEFLLNEKVYRSCIKRREDFLIIEKEIEKKFKSEEEWLIETLDIDLTDEVIEGTEAGLDFQFIYKLKRGALTLYDILDGYLYPLDVDEKKGVMSRIKIILDSSSKKIFEGDQEKENFVCFTHISLKNNALPILSKTEEKEKRKNIKDVSNITEDLTTALSNNPYFYYFYSGNISDKDFKSKRKIFLEDVGSELGKEIFDILKKKIEERDVSINEKKE